MTASWSSAVPAKWTPCKFLIDVPLCQKSCSPRTVHYKSNVGYHIRAWLFKFCAIFSSFRVKEDVTLRSALAEYIDADICDPIIKQNLRQYTTSWPSNVHLLMKLERCKANSPRSVNMI